MASAIPRVLVPLEITDSMVTACSVSEPNTGETAWVSAGTYAIGDRRIRVSTHREYECLAAHTGITTFPESDPNRWQDIGPTDKWAQFDTSTVTQTLAASPYSVTIQPGFFNAIWLGNLQGSQCTVTIKDAPGGTVVMTEATALDGPYLDEWDYCWGPPRDTKVLLVDGLDAYPSAEVTITITAASGQAGVGVVAIGDLRPLLIGLTGGTEYGASAEPVDYSYIDTDSFGTSTLRKGHASTDMHFTALLEKDDADYALKTMQDVLSTPSVWIAADLDGYQGLSVFGKGSGRVVYEGANHGRLDVKVNGLLAYN